MSRHRRLATFLKKLCVFRLLYDVEGSLHKNSIGSAWAAELASSLSHQDSLTYVLLDSNVVDVDVAVVVLWRLPTATLTPILVLSGQGSC